METKSKSTNTQPATILNVYCPVLKRYISIHKKNWEEHIVDVHPEVERHLHGLIKDTLEKPDATASFFTYNDPPFDILIYKKCTNVKPLHNYLKFAIAVGGKSGFVKSIYPVKSIPKQGIVKYECK